MRAWQRTILCCSLLCFLSLIRASPSPSPSVFRADLFSCDDPSLLRPSEEDSSVCAPVTTIASYQIVPNPLYLSSVSPPLHDAFLQRVLDMDADRVRFCPWFPYPQLTVAQLHQPTEGRQCMDARSGYNMTLWCDEGGVIADIEFASFGLPLGAASGSLLCGEYQKSECDLGEEVQKRITALCQGQQSCHIQVPGDLFPGGVVPTPLPPSCGPSLQDLHLLVSSVCDPPQNYSYWDNWEQVDLINMEMMQALTPQRTPIINFSPQPQWIFNISRPTFTDNPLDVDWDYASNTVDDMIQGGIDKLGEYYGRYVAYYRVGQFEDEWGGIVQNPSPTLIDITHYEVLNEPEGEHAYTPEIYTKVFDSTVLNVRKFADPEGEIQFVGMALEGHREWDWYTYFLNFSNHDPAIGTPPDFISFHFYVIPSNTSDPTTYEEIFSQADDFLVELRNISSLRDTLSPSTEISVDEVGLILHDDDAGFPPVAMNAGGACFAYQYLQVIQGGATGYHGIASYHQSQLVGYPPIRGLANQYPSVSMLDWNTGEGNPKYWILKLLREEIPVTVGGKEERYRARSEWGVRPLDPRIRSRILVPREEHRGQIFVRQIERIHSSPSPSPSTISQQKLFLINPLSRSVTLTILGLGGSFMRTVDEDSALGPARNTTLPGGVDQLTLKRFAVACLYLKEEMEMEEKGRVVEEY